MGKNRGAKAALMRQMGEDGAFAPKLPARVARKPPVVCGPELALEMIERFGRGETLSALERDPRYPSRQSFHQFVVRDETLAARWENAKRLHAEVLMEQTGPIADREVIGPDGRHDSGAVQRDKLRIEQRHLRAAALDPARWSRKSEHTVVGDPNKPLTVKAVDPEARLDAFMVFLERTRRQLPPPPEQARYGNDRLLDADYAPGFAQSSDALARVQKNERDRLIHKAIEAARSTLDER
jgi:hypothetical protein